MGDDSCDFGVAGWKPKDGKTHGYALFLGIVGQTNEHEVDDFIRTTDEAEGNDFVPQW